MYMEAHILMSTLPFVRFHKAYLLSIYFQCKCCKYDENLISVKFVLTLQISGLLLLVFSKYFRGVFLSITN